MGNCMQKSNPTQLPEKTDQNQETQELSKENGSDSRNNLRIKIVLTKDELDWLIFQLKFKEGKSLEDVLRELERGRGKVISGWKPSLQSITESPEVPETMDR